MTAQISIQGTKKRKVYRCTDDSVSISLTTHATTTTVSVEVLRVMEELKKDFRTIVISTSYESDGELANAFDNGFRVDHLAVLEEFIQGPDGQNNLNYLVGQKRRIVLLSRERRR